MSGSLAGMRIHVDVHVHLHGAPDGGGGGSDSAILTRLDRIELLLTEAHLSDIPAAITGLTDAIAAVTARVDEDVAHLQDLLAQALMTSADDAATIQRLTDEAAAVVASVTAATASLAAIDPLTDFPAPPEPAP